MNAAVETNVASLLKQYMKQLLPYTRTSAAQFFIKLYNIHNFVQRIAGCTLICIIIYSCDPCRGERICADSFGFRIVDKVTKQDLVFGPVSVYKTDSVYLSTKLPGNTGAMSSYDSAMKKFTSRLLIPVDTFFLRVTHVDTDTVIVNYEYVNSKCCTHSDKGYGQVRSILFNGINTTTEGDIFIFPK